MNHIDTNGKTVVTIVGAWMVLKSVVNLLLGFSLSNVVSLVVAFLLAGILIAGVKYTNYIVAFILAVVVLKNLGYNLTNLQFLYLAEAVVDVVCILGLVLNKNVKEYLS